MRSATTCVRFRKVVQKKTAETDAIFEQMETVRKAVQNNHTVLRLSLDAKASLLIGDYSRGGQNRIVVKALDHDFRAKEKVTPLLYLLTGLQSRLSLFYLQSGDQRFHSRLPARLLAKNSIRVSGSADPFTPSG